jgi:glutathione S-transferase
MLQLFGHPFSSYTQKVLVALYETGQPFTFRWIGPDAPDGNDHGSEWLQRWPLRKFPVLVDGDRTVAETSIIVEYLQLAHPRAVTLLPADPLAALDVRFLDRFFDLHVMAPMQQAVDGALTGDPAKARDALALAVPKLERAYAWLETHLAGRTWAAGDDFTLADCAAAPALFYAGTVQPFPESATRLHAYFERLVDRPSVRQVIEDAAPYFPLYPYAEAIPKRFR